MNVFKKWDELHNPTHGPGLDSVEASFYGWINYKDVDSLIKVARAAEFIYGDNNWHGEGCPGETNFLEEGELPGECECGAKQIRDALAELERSE